MELHCHLIGIISAALLRQLKVTHHHTLITPEALQNLEPVRNRQAFLDWLVMMSPYQSASSAYFLPVLDQHIKQLANQNVCYTEIMLSPTIFPQGTSEALAALGNFRQNLNSLERHSVQIELVMVIPRSLPDDKLKADTEKFIEMYREGLIVGVAVVGLEDTMDTTIKHLYSSLKRLKDTGMGIEIHAGEHGGPEAVRDVLDSQLADRIGHGISAFHDPQLIDRLDRENVHLEFCPTSNLSLGVVKSIETHPVGIALERHMNFSINTDNPGMFGCSLTDEFEQVTVAFSLSDEDRWQIFGNSLKSRFQPALRYIDEAELTSKVEKE